MLAFAILLAAFGLVAVAYFCGMVALYSKRLLEKVSELDDDVYRWLKRNPKLYH